MIRASLPLRAFARLSLVAALSGALATVALAQQAKPAAPAGAKPAQAPTQAKPAQAPAKQEAPAATAG
jgi:hypothetical protein